MCGDVNGHTHMRHEPRLVIKILDNNQALDKNALRPANISLFKFPFRNLRHSLVAEEDNPRVTIGQKVSG